MAYRHLRLLERSYALALCGCKVEMDEGIRRSRMGIQFLEVMSFCSPELADHESDVKHKSKMTHQH